MIDQWFVAMGLFAAINVWVDVTSVTACWMPPGNQVVWLLFWVCKIHAWLCCKLLICCTCLVQQKKWLMSARPCRKMSLVAAWAWLAVCKSECTKNTNHSNQGKIGKATAGFSWSPAAVQATPKPWVDLFQGRSNDGSLLSISGPRAALRLNCLNMCILCKSMCFLVSVSLSLALRAVKVTKYAYIFDHIWSFFPANSLIRCKSFTMLVW